MCMWKMVEGKPNHYPQGSSLIPLMRSSRLNREVFQLYLSVHNLYTAWNHCCNMKVCKMEHEVSVFYIKLSFTEKTARIQIYRLNP